jgi:hypothetical protein
MDSTSTAIAPAYPRPSAARAESGILRWSGPELLTPRLRQQSAEAAIAVCRRLRGRESLPLGPGLAGGWSGLAILFEHADRCYPGDGWASEAQEALGWAARSAAAAPDRLPAGLAAGWAGIAFASMYLARGGERYQDWRGELRPHLARSGIAAATAVRARRGGWPFAEFDHISGLAGLIAGLLGDDFREALAPVAGALVAGTVLEPGRLPWGTASAQIPDQALGARYPGGLVNLGLAHGLGGVVAALALAVGDDAAGENGEHALEVAATALASAVRWVDGLPTLPHVQALGAATRPEGPGRTAWCYGPPGAARALALAGAVLDRPALAGLAADLVVAGLARPASVAGLDTPTFCHGIAGVLQITARMAAETGDPRLCALVPQLCARLLEAFDPESVLGFGALGPRGTQPDVPGLLDGAAGVALVLLSMANEPEPGWDRAFLLS